MKSFYRVFTHNDEFFDFLALVPMISFILNGKIEGGFVKDDIFVPYGEMRLILKLEIPQPVSFMTPAGQA